MATLEGTAVLRRCVFAAVHSVSVPLVEIRVMPGRNAASAKETVHPAMKGARRCTRVSDLRHTAVKLAPNNGRWSVNVGFESRRVRDSRPPNTIVFYAGSLQAKPADRQSARHSQTINKATTSLAEELKPLVNGPL